MTRDQIESWVNDCGSYVEQYREVSKQLSHVRVSINVAKEIGDVKQLESFVGKDRELRRIADAIEAGACDKTNQSDMAAVEHMLQAVIARLKATARLQEQLIEVETQVDFQLKTAERQPEQTQEAFDEGYAALRLEAEQALTMVKRKLQAQLELAEQLLPNKPVLIGV